MGHKEQYENLKKSILKDTSIIKYNRDLFKKFFEWEEKKLKRINGLARLDDSCFKTLKDYPNKFRNVNKWLNNKAWNKLTTKDIEKVYDDLEEGKILNRKGEKFADRRGYYNKVFRGKPFKLAGLSDEVSDALEFYTDKRKKPVRFVNQDNFKLMVAVASKLHHLALLWVEWDIGENISSLLKIKKRNCKRKVDKQTNEISYMIYLPQENLKRSRQQRSEQTIYPETAKFLDALFKRGREVEYRDKKTGQFKRKYIPYEDDDLVFGFGYRQAGKLMDSIVKKSGAKCEPNDDKPTWKDLRSGMACNLLDLGWHAEDINLRLGHSPLSRHLDVYINYLSINRKRAVKNHNTNSLQDVKDELSEAQQREKMMSKRVMRLEEGITEKIQEQLDKIYDAKAEKFDEELRVQWKPIDWKEQEKLIKVTKVNN